MRLAYLIVIVLALFINLTARVSNAKGVSHLKVMKRLIIGGDEEDMRKYLILLGFLEDNTAKGKFSIDALCISSILERKSALHETPRNGLVDRKNFYRPCNVQRNEY